MRSIKYNVESLQLVCKQMHSGLNAITTFLLTMTPSGLLLVELNFNDLAVVGGFDPKAVVLCSIDHVLVHMSKYHALRTDFIQVLLKSHEVQVKSVVTSVMPSLGYEEVGAAPTRNE
jgi:cystathionine beta-lyase/cystathionine gamma-synthase